MRIERNAACRVDQSEALRYLGYSDQEIPGELAARIDAAIELCERVSRPMWAYRVVDGPGPIAGASAVAFLACTIGFGFDREARRLAASGEEAVEAVVFDAAGSSLVEACADACELEVHRAAAAEGLFAGQRMSPGYGDLPLAFSDDIVRALDAGKRLGVSLTESGLLVPQKSVTALVGLFEREEDARRARRSCADCVVRADCAYLAAGRPCSG